jgi:2-dehydro-3-deoxygluconokinase
VREVPQVVTFGEIMIRLNPPGFKRFVQADSFEVSFGGAEASVAVSLANYGISSSYVTCLPSNEIGQAAVNYVRRFGVDTSQILRIGERIGVYYLETGANQRPSKVIYDRSHSAMSEIKPGTIPWDQVFSEANWYHFTGITPALSQNAADECLTAVRSAREKELKISCDLNYRGKLWKYGKSANEVMSKLMPYVDIAIGNEEDCEKVFGIKGANVTVADQVSPEKYREVADKVMERFPNLKKVGVTLRGSVSATFNTWSAVLYDGTKLYTTTKYDITNVVDRVGSGDAFTGALIYSFLTGKSDQEALDFATAASALKHSMPFDLNLVSKEEVESLVREGGAGRVQR